MSLFRAIYISRAVDQTALSMIHTILHKSEANNRRDGVTGMLVHGRGRFLQVVEGERAVLSRLLTRLCRDHRHTDLELIEWTEIAARDFDQWAMGGCSIELYRDAVMPVLRRFSGTPTFDPTLMNAGQCLGFLKEISLLKLPSAVEESPSRFSVLVPSPS